MAGRANRQVIDPWTWIGAGLRKHVQFKRLVEQVFPLEWHNKTGGFDVTTWHAMSVISTKNGWHFWNTFLLLKVDLNLRDFTWNSGQRINNLIKSVMLILFNSLYSPPPVPSTTTTGGNLNTHSTRVRSAPWQKRLRIWKSSEKFKYSPPHCCCCCSTFSLKEFGEWLEREEVKYRWLTDWLPPVKWFNNKAFIWACSSEGAALYFCSFITVCGSAKRVIVETLFVERCGGGRCWMTM